ncbi:MAG: prepilin-type N-terminal cleavage/methylation domain-containing protein [Sulfurovaceae bacterium]|nr:prepilin-type N-terminal cleavage/methylation domain-containing protein [Sulfurovaceae bacterium]
MKKAFTMIELVFVIVVIGILAAVAVPRLAATRDDAVITKARTTIATVRNALAMERQKRILRGNFNPIVAVGNSTNVFGNFYENNSTDIVDTGVPVMEYSISSNTDKGKWEYKVVGSEKQYIFHGTSDIIFIVNTNGKFVCKNQLSDGCKQLTR